jgi:hypothetical protein
MSEATALLIVRRLVAIAIFFYIVTRFTKAADAAGRSPWKWSALGVVAFYGTMFFVMIGGMTAAAVAAPDVAPFVMFVALGGALAAGVFATRAVLRPLKALAAPPEPEPERRIEAPKKRSRLQTIAVWAYIAAFVAVSVVAWLDPEATETRSEQIVDVVVTLLTLIGMVAYVRRLQDTRLIRVWKAVAPLLVVAYAAQLIIGWPEASQPDPESTASEHVRALVFAHVVVIAFLAPAIAMNFRFARGGQAILPVPPQE